MAGTCDFCGCSSNRKYCGVVCQIMARCSGTHDPRRCWIWQGAKRENGYGVVRAKVGGKWTIRTVARAMYAAHYGEVPFTQSVLNICETKNCCNPKHLTLAVQELRLRAERIEEIAT